MFDATQPHLPNTPGVGYKAQHFNDILADAGPVGWLEVHAENYMGLGGRPLAQLRHLSEHFPFSVHGVGLSIGGEGLWIRNIWRGSKRSAIGCNRPAFPNISLGRPTTVPS